MKIYKRDINKLYKEIKKNLHDLTNKQRKHVRKRRVNNNEHDEIGHIYHISRTCNYSMLER